VPDLAGSCRTSLSWAVVLVFQLASLDFRVHFNILFFVGACINVALTSNKYCFVNAPRLSSVHRNWSVPLNSDDFLTTGCRSGFRRANSDQFLSVSLISNEFLSKFPGIFPTKSGPESCSEEIVGVQRIRPKINGIYRICCRKTKKTIGSCGRNSGPGRVQFFLLIID
jgi:hypothetical protein